MTRNAKNHSMVCATKDKVTDVPIILNRADLHILNPNTKDDASTTLNHLLPFVFNYLKSNAETISNPASLDGSHGLHQLNFAGGFYAKKYTVGKGNAVELERVTCPMQSLSIKTTKRKGTMNQGSKFGGPYHMVLGVTRFAGGGENAALKLQQQVSLATLYEKGEIDANDLTTLAWHEKTNSFLEKQDKLNLHVAVNGAHRKVLGSVEMKEIVAISNLDQLLTDAARNQDGKKGIKSKKCGRK